MKAADIWPEKAPAQGRCKASPPVSRAPYYAITTGIFRAFRNDHRKSLKRDDCRRVLQLRRNASRKSGGRALLKFPFILAVVAGLAANAPNVPIPSRPHSENHAIEAQKSENAEAGVPQTRGEAIAGSSKSSPLYVRADCEHGCGYTEKESGLERFKSDPNAWFAAAIAAFTLALFFASIWTNILTSRTIKLARDEFNASHRPRIIIHSVKNSPVIRDSSDDGLDNICATITFFNTGDSTAKIESIFYSIAFRKFPLENGINPIKEFDPRNTIIESGMGDFIKLETDIEMRMWKLRTNTVIKLILIGKIFYRDKTGAFRQTGFCRALDYGANGEGLIWERIDNLEYEYGY